VIPFDVAHLLPVDDYHDWRPSLHTEREIGAMCVMRGSVGQGLVSDWPAMPCSGLGAEGRMMPTVDFAYQCSRRPVVPDLREM